LAGSLNDGIHFNKIILADRTESNCVSPIIILIKDWPLLKLYFETLDRSTTTTVIVTIS